MTIAVLALSVWAVAMTVVALVVIRQISLISVRLDLSMRLPDLAEVGIGPELGMPLDLAPHVTARNCAIVALTGTCNSCHEFARSLAGSAPFTETEVFVLLAGRGAAAREVKQHLPEWVSVVRDPLATELSRRIELSRTTVALHVIDGRLMGRADVHHADDLRALLSASSTATALD